MRVCDWPLVLAGTPELFVTVVFLDAALFRAKSPDALTKAALRIFPLLHDLDLHRCDLLHATTTTTTCSAADCVVSHI